MHRTEGANNVANMFTDGPPGTALEEDWHNAVQEEIANVIEGAGLTLKTAGTETRDQLLAAIQMLCVEPDEVLGKNVLINGAFRINQRGATYTSATSPANSDDTYLLDRWLLLSDGNDIVDVSRSDVAPDNADHSILLDVETINKKFGICQIVQSANCIHLTGGAVSLSFWAKVSDATKLDNIKAVVLSWTGAVDTVTSDVVSNWNAEDTTPTFAANWTAENIPVNLNVTNTWQKFEINNIALDTAGAVNVAVLIWSDGFCNALGTFLYITNVQLEYGEVATEYDWKSVGDEMSLCNRYFCKSYARDIAPGTSTTDGSLRMYITAVTNADHDMAMTPRFPVEMFTDPTVTLYDAVGNAGKVTMAAGNNIAGTSSEVCTRSFHVIGTNGAISTSRVLRVHYKAEAEL